MPIRTELVDLTFQQWLDANLNGIEPLEKLISYWYHEHKFGCRDNIVWVDTPEVQPDLAWLEELVALYDVVMVQRTGKEREIEVRLCYAREAEKEWREQQ